MHYTVIKNKIEKVDIIEENEIKIKVRILRNNRILKMKRKHMFDTIQEAELYIKEKQLIKNFKKKQQDRNGNLKCCYCSKVSNQDMTVDHIVSLKTLGKRKNIRKDTELWNLAWDESNFQIACKECNQQKSYCSDEEFQSILKNLEKKGKQLAFRKNKLMAKQSKHANKVSFGMRYRGNETIGELYSQNGRININVQELDMQIARMDSRIIPVELILS